jgi:hypothetical protein
MHRTSLFPNRSLATDRVFRLKNEWFKSDRLFFRFFLSAFFPAAALSVSSPVNFSTFRALITFSHGESSFVDFKAISRRLHG